MNGEMPKMPAASGWRTRYRSEPGMIEVESLYTADQMREFANEATRLAMEQCADVCDAMVKANFDYSAKGAARDCASAIRSALSSLNSTTSGEDRHG